MSLYLAENPSEFDMRENRMCETAILNIQRLDELHYEISCALECMDIDCINELGEEINLLSNKFPTDHDVSILLCLLNESKHEIISHLEFEETKTAMKKSYIDFGMDEDSAEEEAKDFAWKELVNKRKNNIIIKNSC